MKINKKKLAIFGIIATIIIAGVLWFVSSKNSKSEVEIITAKVIKTDLRIAFSIDGKLEAEKYEPGFLIGGKVSQVLVKEGDVVKKGQWLAVLDTQDAQKNLEKTLRDYSIQRNEFDEADQVTYADNVVTDTLKRILEKNQWNLEKAVLDVELKDLAIKQARVLAPIAGVVAQLNIKMGDVVSTQNQSPVATIISPGSYEFVAYAEEDEALRIEDGQTVSVQLDAYSKENFPSKLIFLSPISTIDSNGLTSYRVTVDLENPDNKKIMDGMEGSVLFITKEVPDVLAISNKAVYRENNLIYVDVIDEAGKISKTVVETGFTDGKNVEIVSGLKVGQEIILKN